MKKLVLFVGVALFGMSANAQMPGDGESPHSFEVQFGDNFGGGNSLISTGGIKYRYFLNSNMAVRVGLGYGSSSQDDNVEEGGTGTGTGVTVDKNSNFSFAPGFEYHFGATERMSPYAAVDVVIGSGKATSESTNNNGGAYMADYSRSYESKNSSFGVQLLAGMDFYVAQNFFLGAEFGFAWMSYTDKASTESVTSGGVTVTTDGIEQKSSGTGIGAVGGIRAGWRF